MNNLEYFNENGYVIVRNVVSKELTDFLTQYAFLDEKNNFDFLNLLQISIVSVPQDLRVYGHRLFCGAHCRASG